MSSNINPSIFVDPVEWEAVEPENQCRRLTIKIGRVRFPRHGKVTRIEIIYPSTHLLPEKRTCTEDYSGTMQTYVVHGLHGPGERGQVHAGGTEPRFQDTTVYIRPPSRQSIWRF